MAEKVQDGPEGGTLAAEILLRGLGRAGVGHLFFNPGTDFAPIVEAYCRDPAGMPRPVIAAHETIALSMAHGSHLATGAAAAVMVHTNVGTANALCNLINAARDGIPLVVMAGRTPFTQEGLHGSRSGMIHWGQEMFDQGGMVREAVKWDFELKHPSQAAEVAARAVQICRDPPAGPVYLSLPREVLGMAAGDRALPVPPPARRLADPRALETAADWIAAARAPVIVTSAAGRDPQAVAALARLAEAARIPVVEHAPRYLNLPHSHPWHAGFDPAPLLRAADLVLVVEAEVPWFPRAVAPAPGARVVHVALDPLYPRYPFRSYPGDLNIPGDLAANLAALGDLVQGLGAERVPPARRPPPAGDRALTFDSASAAIAGIVDDRTVIFNEYPLKLPHCPLDRPGSYYGLSTAGGLGWGLGAALGYRLAAPDSFVIATLGDGAYIFANPVAGHSAAAALGLATLTVVFNNRRYGAVQRSTLSMYAQGAAAQSKGLFMAELDGTPSFAEIARAHGALGETVETLPDLHAALARGKAAVLAGRPALVEIGLDR